jgi:hypothetical protein
MIAPLYTAVFAALDGLTVNSVAIPIFENAPETQPPPFVTFELSIAASSERTGQAEMQLHVWCADPIEGVVAILQACASRLDRQRLSTTVGNATALLDSTPPIGRDPDTRLRHGVQIYRILIHT